MKSPRNAKFARRRKRCAGRAKPRARPRSARGGLRPRSPSPGSAAARVGRVSHPGEDPVRRAEEWPSRMSRRCARPARALCASGASWPSRWRPREPRVRTSLQRYSPARWPTNLQAAIEAIDRAIKDEEQLPPDYAQEEPVTASEASVAEGSNVVDVDFDPA